MLKVVKKESLFYAPSTFWSACITGTEEETDAESMTYKRGDPQYGCHIVDRQDNRLVIVVKLPHKTPDEVNQCK